MLQQASTGHRDGAAGLPPSCGAEHTGEELAQVRAVASAHYALQLTVKPKLNRHRTPLMSHYSF
jgi:hypothetical protein